MLRAVLLFAVVAAASAAAKCHEKNIQAECDALSSVMAAGHKGPTFSLDGTNVCMKQSIKCKEIGARREKHYTLMNLDLSEIKFRGPLPKGVGVFKALTRLYASMCEIKGAFPELLFDLTELVYLDLSHNHLEGPIPTAIGKLNKLHWLVLKVNHLTGAVPKEIGKLTKLWTLELARNQLTSIPASLANLRDLTYLDLHYNLLADIPAKLCALLKRVALSGAQPGDESGQTHCRFRHNKLVCPLHRCLDGYIESACDMECHQEGHHTLKDVHPHIEAHKKGVPLHSEAAIAANQEAEIQREKEKLEAMKRHLLNEQLNEEEAALHANEKHPGHTEL